MAFLLDTNVISELRKADRCSPSVRRWRDQNLEHDLFLSVVVFGELRRGIEMLRPRDFVTALTLERWMNGLIVSFGERVLPVTLEICEQWGRISAGVNLPPADVLLAATAQCYNLTVATRNERDFQRCGVDYVNPFAA